MASISCWRAAEQRGARAAGSSTRAVLRVTPLPTRRRLLSIGEQPGQDFFRLLASKLEEYKVATPTVQIEYRNLCVRARAVAGSDGIATAGNFGPRLVKVRACICFLAAAAAACTEWQQSSSSLPRVMLLLQQHRLHWGWTGAPRRS